MDRLPLISIVTPSYNQARYIRETLQSLVDQNYPRLEVIIQDGGSTDGAVAIAEEFVRRHPEAFHLFVEKDAGQADALNRGFARTHGEILGFLNSDDTLFPGCLASVARELDPARGRPIVFGRCVFTGEGSRYVGIEHPAEYRGHFDFLAIWRRGYNTMPQPSVFWHRDVWQKCGGFDPGEHHVLDYDLFCRFSRRYRFHKVDELWSTYRMHEISKSAQRSEAEVLELSVRASRKHWGPWFSPLRWKLALSFWFHRQNGHERARHHARRCEEAAAAGARVRAVKEFVCTAFSSPKMARDRLLLAWLSTLRIGFLQRFLREDGGFTGRYGDLWVGPVYRDHVIIPQDATRLILVLQHHPHGSHHTIELALRLNGQKVAQHCVTAAGQFTLSADVTKHRGRRCGLELRAGPFFIPRMLHNTPDDRRLVVQLLSTTLEK